MSTIKSHTVIDGSQGEGGGQIFRTSLTLSLCLGIAVRIKNIRAGRRKPGLLRQHLACLRAAQTISGARVTGAELGSTEVAIEPEKVNSGEYEFAIGSAGSTTLVLQTILLPLLMADGTSEVRISGGTHNGMAPSYEFLAQSFLPAMRKAGYEFETEIHSYGFYPAGGGEISAIIHGVKNEGRVEWIEPGARLSQRAIAISARLPEHIGQRELHQVQKKCFWSGSSLEQKLVDSPGPGNIISLRVKMEQASEVFESLAEHNISAERVAGRAIRSMNRFLKAGVPVGEYLADQLVVPLALGSGGSFRTLEPSKHLMTNIEVVRLVTGIETQAKQLGPDDWLVEVNR